MIHILSQAKYIVVAKFIIGNLVEFPHASLKSANHPAIQAGSLPVSQVANLPGYYEIPNETRDPLLIAHNFSNVLSTMRT
jgi:hypothetical protein